MLVLDRVTFAYPGQSVPYDFSLQAEPGEVTAVTGASGSGKSTLLDLIAGFLLPSAGSIRLGDTDLLPLPPEARPVSVLFQSETLFDHLSAAHNVALGLPSRLPRRKAAEQVRQALAEVGLPELGEQPAATLSGGQKQRVALARTLLRARPVLLLDEPFSALDDETRGTTRNLVKSLTEQQNWVTLLVSHHSEDVAAMARRRYHNTENRLLLS
ncbi:MAG TPA: ATP-binding cassette domain-containing protein [Devosiaceae bacterium]|jgi:thiamine transport system ATP-binding protein|nr:ATP-binding cassette domain-containing protein [Devosiaceae bacterium]